MYERLDWLEKNNEQRALHAFLGGLCPAYLAATAEERAAVRQGVALRQSLPDRVRDQTVTLAGWIQSPADAGLLREGFAAMSIENCAMDYRDTPLALAELWVRAERSGIEPQPHFEAVGALSSDEAPRGGCRAMSQMLPVFHTYAVVSSRRGKQ